jgi:two-component system, sensor histidine kinase and response regulator
MHTAFQNGLPILAVVLTQMPAHAGSTPPTNSDPWLAPPLILLYCLLAALLLTPITIAFRRWQTRRTARHHQEERFHLIARATNDTIWDWNLLTDEIWWSEGIHAAFGYPATPALSNATWWDQHIHPDDRARVLSGLRQLIERNEQVWSAEYRFARADGSYAEVLDRAYLIRNQLDHPVRMVGAMMDITERNQVLRDLATARDHALEALRLKSEFLANISHEVRTPLNGIVGMTTLLQDTPLDREQQSYVDTVQSCTETLLAIINDILDFSKLEAGKLHFEHLDFHLRDTLDTTIEILADRAQAKHIELVTLVEGDVPDRLRGDPGRLRQVLANLIVNALKFTDQGEVIVQVSRTHDSPHHVTLLFTVRDTGLGIPKEALPYLFQAFSQVDGSTTRKHGGTGLGLAISKQLVELMGGQIGVESTLGHGSTFWFTVRLQSSADAPPSPPPSLPTFAHARVLVADRHPATQRLLLNCLSALGTTPTVLPSHAGLMQHLQSAAQTGSPFHLVILEVDADQTHNFDTIRTLKANPLLQRLPVLVIAPRSHHGDTTFFRSHGIGGIIHKPLRQRLLVQAITRLLSTPDPHQTRLWLDRRPSPKTPPFTQSLTPPVPCRILVAEDNPVNQRVALALLERLGCKAHAVGTGPEVLDALASVHYHVILLDCQLPELDGFDVARQIRQQQTQDPRHPRPYLIAMTAFAQPGARELCLAAGMDDYLSKPVRLDLLASSLQKAFSALPSAPSHASSEHLQTPASDPLPPTTPPSQIITLDPAALDVFRQLASPTQPRPLDEMARLFIEQTSQLLRELDRSVARYEAPESERIAHRLRGSAITMGATRLADLCSHLEHESAKGNLQVASHFLAQIRGEFTRVQSELDSLTTPDPTSPGPDSPDLTQDTHPGEPAA